MLVRDPAKLAVLMAIAGLSTRQLAKAAGWGSHSYMGRLLRGEVRTLRVEPAVRIALALGADVDDLFVTHVTPNQGGTDQHPSAA